MNIVVLSETHQTYDFKRTSKINTNINRTRQEDHSDCASKSRITWLILRAQTNSYRTPDSDILANMADCFYRKDKIRYIYHILRIRTATTHTARTLMMRIECSDHRFMADTGTTRAQIRVKLLYRVVGWLAYLGVCGVQMITSGLDHGPHPQVRA